MHNLAKVVTDFDVDIFDIVCEKDRSEANSAFDATLGREGARFDSDPDNKWVANYPDAIRLRFAPPLRRYNSLCTGKKSVVFTVHQLCNLRNRSTIMFIMSSADGEECQKSECGAGRLPRD